MCLVSKCQRSIILAKVDTSFLQKYKKIFISSINIRGKDLKLHNWERYEKIDEGIEVEVSVGTSLVSVSANGKAAAPLLALNKCLSPWSMVLRGFRLFFNKRRIAAYSIKAPGIIISLSSTLGLGFNSCLFRFSHRTREKYRPPSTDRWHSVEKRWERSLCNDEMRKIFLK